MIFKAYKIFCLAAVLSTIGLPVVAAEVSGTSMNTEAGRAIFGVEQAYEKAKEDLTQDQIDYLNFLDEELRQFIEPDLELIEVSVAMENCLPNDDEMLRNSADFELAFKRYKEIKEAEKQQIRDHHKALRAKATFIDTSVLFSHVRVEMLNITEEIATQALLAAQEGTVSCADVKATFDSYNVMPGGMTLPEGHNDDKNPLKTKR